MSTHLTQTNSNETPHVATYLFRLYIAGESPNSMRAIKNLKELCQKYFEGDFKIDIVDVLLSPERAWAEGVMVTPMTVRISPQPEVKIIGNLNDKDQVLSTLNFMVK